jgi:hypothetical protein
MKVIGYTLEHSELLRRLDYSRQTGDFTRKTVNGGCLAGTIAGTVQDTGYRWIAVAGKRYAAHRLAWFYVHGTWPEGEIDHINRLRDDNRISNLRDVDRQTNNINTSIRADNKSGFKGVHWHKQSSKWRASARRNGKPVHLGSFRSQVEASAAYQAFVKQEGLCG